MAFKLASFITIVIGLTVITTPAAATSVPAGDTSVTSLGTFAAGTYHITASGVIELAAAPGLFDTGPDGVPVTPVLAAGYGYCNPGGCSVDNPGGGAVGPGGIGVNFGTLLGSFSATPTSPSDFFTIGYGTTVTLAAVGQIYGLVNDTFYPNDIGSYSVSVGSVPEPASWALMICGIGLVGGVLRRRPHRNLRFA